MLVGQWSSEYVPEHHQFDFVRALLLDTPVPIRIERPGIAPERAFEATAEIHAFAPDVMMARNTGQAAVGLRESQEIARGAPDNLWVLRYRTTAGTMVLNGRPYHVEPGDVLFGDCGVQQLGDGAEYVEFEMWMLPVSRIKPLLADPAADPVGHLKVGTPLGHLVSSFVGDLGAALATVDGQG